MRPVYTDIDAPVTVHQAYRDAVHGPAPRRAARVTVLDSDLNPVSGGTVPVLDGSVVIDRNSDTRRTCSFTLSNEDAAWTPLSSASMLWWDKLVRIERGLYVGSELWWTELGVFYIDRPIVEVTPDGSRIQVQGRDRMKRASKSQFTLPTTVAAGTALRTVIYDLASGGGMGTTRYNLTDNGATLGYAKTWEVGDSRVRAMLDVAQDHNLWLYVDGSGTLVLEPVVPLADLPTVWTFERGEEAIMLGLTRELSDDEYYTHVLVTGESSESTPVRGEAIDAAAVAGWAGDRLYRYVSPFLTTNLQCQDFARTLLYEHALIEEVISIPSVVVPPLEAGDAIAVVETISGVSDRYVVDRITMPLGRGPMSVQTRKLRRLT